MRFKWLPYELRHEILSGMALATGPSGMALATGPERHGASPMALSLSQTRSMLMVLSLWESRRLSGGEGC